MSDALWEVLPGKKPRAVEIRLGRRRPHWTVSRRCIVCTVVRNDEFYCGSETRESFFLDDPFICLGCLEFLPPRRAVDRSISWGDHFVLARLYTVTRAIEGSR